MAAAELGKNGMSDHRLGQFRLRRILSIGDDGRPTLEQSNARVMMTGRASGADVGRMAVCQDLIDEDVATVVVLGVVAEGDTDGRTDDAPMVLRHGAASLSLHRDGRIRLKGDDIALDAAAGMRFLAAKIDLN